MHKTQSLIRVLSLSVAAVVAAQNPADKPTTPFVAMSASAPSANTAMGAAWERFKAANPGTWWSRWSPATGTPKEIYGEGIPLSDWGGDTIEEARRHANRLLVEQAELLGLGTSEFREVIGGRMGQTWVFVYDQYFRGLPVIGGRADVRVHAVGRVPMFGSVAWQIPADFNTTPLVSELQATAIAWDRQGARNDVPQPVEQKPRLVIWGDTLSPVKTLAKLAWEIPISNVDANGDGPIGRFYIDARTGGILHYENDKHQCDMHPQGQDQGPGKKTVPQGPPSIISGPASGNISAPVRTGLPGNGAVQVVPMPGLLVTSGAGSVFTDTGGNFTIPSVFLSTTATYTTAGVHCQSISGSNSPVFAQGLTIGSNPPAQFSCPTDFQLAHTTTYWWVWQVNEFCRSVLGNTAQLNVADAIHPTVNIASTCNAYYTGNTINFYAAGGGCVNTAYSTVIAHEWGHGLDDRYGGISQTEGLSEGWGDIIAMYLTDQAIVGDFFFTNGGIIRTGNNSRTYPPPAEVHAAGEVWMGFAWQLRQRLATHLARSTAISITNDIVLGSIIANATDQQGALLQAIIADDSDGNLANLTPHATDIVFAANLKHYPYPFAAAPSNDECVDAIQIYNGTWSGNNDTALNSDPGFACTPSGSKDIWYKYLAGVGPLTITTCGLTSTDTVIEIFSGTCGSLSSMACNDDSCSSLQSTVSVNITQPGYYYFRIGGWNNRSGAFQFSVNGTEGNLASEYTYGLGCNRVSKAFLELFDPSSTFDLNLATMRLTRSGATAYSVAPGGSYHVPAATATVLALTDDSDVTVPFTGTFNFPGGSTTSFVVCSNGFVSMGTGNGTNFFPIPGDWANSPVVRYGTWHDFNPSRSGSGQIKFEQIGGSTGIVYITWDGVYDFASSTPNTWQLQFNLASSTVTFVWPTMSGQGNRILVGYAPGGSNPEPDSTDISTAMPFTTNTANTFPLTLAGTLPVIGSTSVLTTTRFPAGSPLGAVVESLTQDLAGTSLASLGMPRCFRYTGTNNVTNLVFPSGGQAVFNQPVPNTPTLMGIQISVQSYAFASGANALGVIASNGVQLTVGF